MEAPASVLPQTRQSSLAVSLIYFWVLTGMVWWGLAFYPVSTISPEWLVRTKYVCFGTLDNGLPAAWGWMTLFLGPFMLLGSMFVAFGNEIQEGWKVFRKIRFAQFLTYSLAVACAAEAFWVSQRIGQGLRLTQASALQVGLAEPLPIEYPQLSREIAEFNLVNQRGERVDNSFFRGKATILTFAFAHCPSVCPALIHQTTAALKKLEATKAQALFISLDPWRDTPGALPGLAAQWSFPANAQVLSDRKPEKVTELLDQLGVPWQRDPKTGDIVHPALVYIVNPQGKITYAFNNPSVDWLLEAIHRVNP